MKSILLKNAQIINRGSISYGDILIREGRLVKIDSTIDSKADIELNCTGKVVIPGIIDDQVHFREPGLIHKADLFTEPQAAVAGGVTSFMEMPNTKPPATTQELLAEKYASASRKSLANYSFYMGASNDNLDEVLRTDGKNICGVKVFMGSSTGKMLVDNPVTIDSIFANCPLLIATHCEDEITIKQNEEAYREKYGENVPMRFHPDIRSEVGCYLSSSLAVELAKKHGTRLHILHLSTEKELGLFSNLAPLIEKRITAEVCVHHLFFNNNDYEEKGTLIKCNPAIKHQRHQKALFTALLDDRLDVIATDHAPHTWEEKQATYFMAPSGLPLVQHSLNIMMEFYQRGLITMERIVEKMCHAPAICFGVEERGYIDEGYWADLAVIDPNEKWVVSKNNIHYKCRWSPLEMHEFTGRVESTIVSGHLAFHKGLFDHSVKGKRLTFGSK